MTRPVALRIIAVPALAATPDWHLQREKDSRTHPLAPPVMAGRVRPSPLHRRRDGRDTPGHDGEPAADGQNPYPGHAGMTGKRRPGLRTGLIL